MRRIYAESWGHAMPAFAVPVGAPLLEVLASMPGIMLRQPNRWERAIESIVFGEPGRVVSKALRIVPLRDEWPDD